MILDFFILYSVFCILFFPFAHSRWYSFFNNAISSLASFKA